MPILFNIKNIFLGRGNINLSFLKYIIIIRRKKLRFYGIWVGGFVKCIGDLMLNDHKMTHRSSWWFMNKAECIFSNIIFWFVHLPGVPGVPSWCLHNSDE